MSKVILRKRTISLSNEYLLTEVQIQIARVSIFDSSTHTNIHTYAKTSQQMKKSYKKKFLDYIFCQT